MWKVSLNNYLQTLEFEFEEYVDATDFILAALKANKTMRATISFEDEVEEGEE